MVENELYVKKNTKAPVKKKKNTIQEALVIDVKDNKFFNSSIFYESLNNVTEAISFDSYINLSFDAPSRDDLNNYRLEFYTIIDKYLNEDYEGYVPE
jgi:hypothetical protein